MSEQEEKLPRIIARKSLAIELEAGKYFWCSCGKSAHQPFCDGSHKGTGFQPVKFELPEKKTVHLCQCKHTKNPPFCDGTHKTLAE